MATEKPVNKKHNFAAFGIAAATCLLMWLALPPMKFSWLGWIALTPLSWLIIETEPRTKLLRQVWLAHFIGWMVTLHFVRLPFWGLWFGWALLSFYLALYGPLFVASARTLVHRFRIPAVVAIPISFTGCEWIRVNFLTGFGLGCLSHSQYETIAALPLAALFGAYGITFAMAMVAATLGVATLPIKSESSKNESDQRTTPLKRIAYGLLTGMLMLGVLGYGTWQLEKNRDAIRNAAPPEYLDAAVIQPSIDTLLKPMTQEEVEAHFVDRCRQTHAARESAERGLDVIIWPESSFQYADYLSDHPAGKLSDLKGLQFLAWRMAMGTPDPFPDAVPMIVGTSTQDPQSEKAWNSAVLFDTYGNPESRYYKNHLVMFGEYFPLVNSIPGFSSIFRGFSSWDAGTESVRFEVDDVSMAPTICFETTVPRLIRRQLNTLESEGEQIDVLVNVTNDGWFFGTSCLDLHLACNVMRAAEMRRPMLVSANTGLSAQIDEMGRLVQVGERRQAGHLICAVRVPQPEITLYRRWGNWFAIACGLLVCIALVLGRFMNRPNR